MILEKLSSATGVASREDIRRWRRGLRERRGEILEALHADTGKIPEEGYLMEWVPVESALKFLEENVEEVFRPKPIESSLRAAFGRRRLMQRRLPVGRVAVVGTWNFPLSLHLTQILFAAAAGNRVSFKASPFSPALGKALGAILPGVLGPDRFEHWVPASDEDCLERIRTRGFDLVIFTGGTGGAKIFAKACGEAMIPFIAEASGSEAAVVLSQALQRADGVERRVDHLLWALFHHTGQTCVSPRFWFVPARRLDAVWEAAVRQMEAAPESARSRSKLQNDRVAAENQSWQRWAAGLPGVTQASCSVRPEFALFRLASIDSLPAETPGTFGPSAIVVGYDRLEDVVDWSLRSPWSLLTTILGDPGESEMRSLERLDTTVVSLNEAVVAAGDAAVPFGGRGNSGYGVCHGVDGLLALSRVQTWQQVSSWPGAELINALPSWKTLVQLRKVGSFLKELDDNPLNAVRSWMKWER